jgi:endogenous inhibitor of DNA gyrase (YacG/DUF329 family)
MTDTRDQDARKQDGSPSSGQFTCPTCKRRVNRSTDGSSGLPRFFHFCSERCKLIDLGAWFDADYRIAAKPDDESEESLDPSCQPGRRVPGE